MLMGRTTKTALRADVSIRNLAGGKFWTRVWNRLATIAIYRRAVEVAMQWNWRELVGLSLFLALFGAALIANVRDVSPSRGAWVTQAMR
jgi:hypothetical protein